jgi:hypothetical protein
LLLLLLLSINGLPFVNISMAYEVFFFFMEEDFVFHF